MAMSDVGTVLWKELAEFIGNRRFLRVFGLAVLAMGILPALSALHAHGASGAVGSYVVLILRVVYALFAAVMVVSQTAPDLVLHERVGHTLDYLLATRLPDSAIFGAKVLAAAAVGYVAAILSIGVQLAVIALRSGNGWQWLFLSLPEGRIIAFGMTVGLTIYVAVVGTFVALRVGEQRAAYMVTLFSVGVLIIPLALGWIPVTLTAAWLTHAAVVLFLFSVVLGLVGLRLFRREMLVLYLQE
jgi:ABC-type Na+ efflux pump permease subunit